MTSGSIRVSHRSIARGAFVATLATALTATTIAPAAAASKPAKVRSAQNTATIQDVSGLSVTRTWKISKDDRNTLVTKITVQNSSSTPVTTTIAEPIPTTSLKRITFKPLKMRTSSVPGLGRYEITVPNGGTVSFGYTARLTPERKATPQERLVALKSEIEASLPAAQATEADRALAALKFRYSGLLEVTELTSEGVTPLPTPPSPATIILTLTPTPNCRVVGRGCRFTAGDSYLREPKLAALDPIGTALTANAAADLPQSGFTCGGAEEPGVNAKHWTFEPTAWRLTWAGWEVTQGRYTIVTDLTSPDNGRCYAAAVHSVTTGLMNG